MDIRAIEPIKFDIFQENTKNAKTNGREVASFEDFFKKAIYDVNDSKKHAEDLNREFMAGNLENMHDLTIAQAESNFKFQALVEVNNKMLDAYREITRIQI